MFTALRSEILAPSASIFTYRVINSFLGIKCVNCYSKPQEECDSTQRVLKPFFVSLLVRALFKWALWNASKAGEVMTQVIIIPYKQLRKKLPSLHHTKSCHTCMFGTPRNM